MIHIRAALKKAEKMAASKSTWREGDDYGGRTQKG